jgi:pilus assembly protein CpaF
MEGENIVLKDIFSFKQEGLNSEGKIMGRYIPTGVQPNFYERLEAAGAHIPESMFLEN